VRAIQRRMRLAIGKRKLAARVSNGGKSQQNDDR
jgi:hypothetical protein